MKVWFVGAGTIHWDFGTGRGGLYQPPGQCQANPPASAMGDILWDATLGPPYMLYGCKELIFALMNLDPKWAKHSRKSEKSP